MTHIEALNLARSCILASLEYKQGKATAVEAVEDIDGLLAQPVQEPFGYFKAEPFGWTDCAETDEGAVALYDKFKPDWDAMAVMVEEQQRMSKRILELEALLERQTALLERQTARIADLQTHIENFDGEDT